VSAARSGKRDAKADKHREADHDRPAKDKSKPGKGKNK
jgi:hypothetical protein